MENKKFNEWVDLGDSELARTYVFPDGSKYTIILPKKLYVKKSGSHKIIDDEGVCHYVRSGWNAFFFTGEFTINVED